MRALAVAAAALVAFAVRARAADAPPTPGVATGVLLVVGRPFEEAFGRFVPVFPATTARYFGYTDLGPQPGDAISAPAEVERYAVLVPSPLASAVVGEWAPRTAAATAAPHPLLRITGGGPLSRAWSAPGSAFAATGWQATVAAPSGAWRGKVAARVSEELRGTSAAPASARVGSQSTASLQLRLVDPLTLELEGHRIAERGGPGDGVVVDGARARAALVLVPRVLDVSASAGADRVQADADVVATERTAATVGVTAHLTPALSLSGSAAVQTGVLTPAATAGALFGQLPASRLSTAAVAWRVSDRLQLSAALSRVGTPIGPELARQLRAAWTPLPGGRLRLAAAYEESVDPASGLLTSQAVLQPSLRLGRHTGLEASVTEAIRRVAGPVAHPLAVMISFSVRA